MESHAEMKKSINNTKKRENSIILYKIKKNPMAILGIALISILILLAIFAPLISTYDPIKINLQNKLLPPSMINLFGTDEAGRDIFTRVLYGARVSLSAGIIVVLFSSMIGCLLGAYCGYFGKWVDQIIMRIMDMVLAFPTLILAMVLAATLGPNLINAMIAIAIVKIPVYVRLSRGETLSVKNNLFVKASQTFGAPSWYIILRHIIPNTIMPVIIQLTLDIGDTILLIATLGFLGLGARPPQPEWGTMISTGFKHMLDAWWYSTFPGIAIFLASTGFNLLGDALRDIFDPKSTI